MNAPNPNQQSMDEKHANGMWDRWFAAQPADHQKNYCATHRAYKGGVDCRKCTGQPDPVCGPASSDWKTFRLPKHLR